LNHQEFNLIRDSIEEIRFRGRGGQEGMITVLEEGWKDVLAKSSEAGAKLKELLTKKK
jgi:hypothetical protein